MTDIKQTNLKKLANGLIIDGESGKVEIQFIDNGKQVYEFAVPAPDLLLDFMIGLLLEGKTAFGDDFTSLFNSIAGESDG